MTPYFDLKLAINADHFLSDIEVTEDLKQREEATETGIVKMQYVWVGYVCDIVEPQINMFEVESD